MVLLESFWAWGWIAASLVAFLIIPVYGWRAAFFVGALPALFAAVLRFSIPESPRYLEIAGRHGWDAALVAQIARLYVTHPGVTSEGIMTKMGL